MARVLQKMASKHKKLTQEDGGKTEDSSTVQLDKFKRRLVRAVARLRQQKLEEEAMWKVLKTEIGCDCKNLWQQMRALTLKKLRRLLPANDMLDGITKVARLTATDWLLFDLLLVHEHVDVISLGEPICHNITLAKEPDCLRELFELVKHHDVERLSGDDLLEAWIRITLEYNSKGRQTSPMMLQLRWHQMKETSRAGFYNFWCSYRGNPKYLPIAMKYSPTQLQTEIVTKFNKIVIKESMTWETLIEQKRVILSEEFTQFREAKRKAGKARSDKETELELIEPQVETIDLDGLEANRDSIEKDKPNEATIDEDGNICRIVSVKSEPADDVVEIDNPSDCEATLTSTGKTIFENMDNICENEDAIISNLDEFDDNETLPTITSIVGNAVEVDKTTSEDEMNDILEEKAKSFMESLTTKDTYKEDITDATSCVIDEEMNEILRQKVDSLKNVEITHVKSEYDSEQVEIEESTASIELLDESKTDTDTSKVNEKTIQCDSDDEIDKLLQEKAEQFMNIEIPQMKCGKDEEISHVKSDVIMKTAKTFMEEENEHDESAEEKLIDGCDEAVFDDNGIEFVDDGIEFIDGDHSSENKNGTHLPITIKEESESDSEDENTDENGDSTSIDLKLLMDPTVYTKKLDFMEVFKFTDYYSVSDKRVIESALIESKPVDKRALKEEDIKNFREQVDPDYKADVSEDDKDIIQTSREIEDARIKYTSWLLQKPKNRSYNPIQLCKNPDFNTRLKRLTAGFHSLNRNRELLKECKPLTIDLHKAFEKKLVDGTLYLKGGNFKNASATVSNTTETELKLPLPIPTLKPNCDQIVKIEPNVDITTPVTAQECDVIMDQEVSKLPKSLPTDRRKVINLPDINQVRLVNQSLLTAEVTPIRIGNTSDLIEDKETAITSTEAKGTPIIAGVIKNDSEFTESYITINQTQTTNKPASDLEKKKTVKPNYRPGVTKKLKSVENQQKATSTPTKDGVVGLWWKPKYVKNYFADSLLTIDTLNRILSLINEEKESKEKEEESKEKLKEHKTNTKIKKSSSEANSKSVTKTNGKVEFNKPVPQKSINTKLIQKKGSFRGPTTYKGIYCCWAREKIFMGLKRPMRRHGCIKFQCTCCCRAELNVNLNHTRKTFNEEPLVKKNSATIVLSDDEEAAAKANVGIDRNSNVSNKGTDIPVTVTAGATSQVEQQNPNPDVSNKPLVTPIVPTITIEPLLQGNMFPNEQGQRSTEAQTTKTYQNNKDIRGTCKTFVIPARGHPYANSVPIVPKVPTTTVFLSPITLPPTYPSAIKSQKPPNTMIMSSSEIKRKPARNPIFLGKNKILLCSLKKNKPVELPSQLPVLPNGLNFVLLPTGDLTLSIAPGVELDSQQLCILPALMSIVQTQLDKIRIGNQTLTDVSNLHHARYTATKQNLEQHNSALATKSDSSLTKSVDLTQNLEGPTVSTAPQTFNISSQNPACEIKINQTEVTVLKPDNVHDISADTTINNSKELETNAEERSEKSHVNQADIDSQQERQTDESIANSSHDPDSMLKHMLESAPRSMVHTTNSNADDKNVNSRKTILSDLMEMSGISKEDTTMATDVSMAYDTSALKTNEPSLATTTLSPIVIPLTKPLDVISVDNVMDPASSGHVSITGPYSNLLSFTPTNSTNYLLNSLGYLRPELNAVTSFADLKYACEKDGEFFKLEVDTGVISPINVCIKKNFKTPPTSINKEVIDLTDDAGDDLICTQEDKTPSNEKEPPRFSFHVVSEKKRKNIVVKPLKLFKAVHPRILKNVNQVHSIMKMNTHKSISILRRNNKAQGNVKSVSSQTVVNSVNDSGDKLVNSTPKPASIEDETPPPLRYYDSTGDSSDDEPLAKKSKRMKETENKVEEKEVLEPADEDTVEEEIAGVPEIPAIGEGDYEEEDIELSGTDIQGVNPELNPVAFEEEDSDDDLCILGV